MTSELILNALIWAIIIYFGLRLLAARGRDALQHELDATVNRDLKKLRDRFRLVKIEQHGDCLYLFDAQTDEFIAQGRSAQEFMDRFSDDTTLRIVEGDQEVRERFKNMFPNTQVA